MTVTDKDGTSTTSTFDKVEIMIGRLKGGVRPNDIVLRAENVQRHHARIVVKDNRLILIHLNCRETFVNGNKVLKPQLLYDGDKVSIGDFTLEVHKIGESWGPDFSEIAQTLSLDPSSSTLGGSDTSNGQTPLHTCNDADLAKVLIDAGADVNAKDNDGNAASAEASDAAKANYEIITFGHYKQDGDTSS